MIQALRKLLGIAYVWCSRAKILRAVQGDSKSAWPLIVKVWSLSSGLYQTRIGAAAKWPFELQLLEELLNSSSDCEGLLENNISHENPYVAAYCLLGLARLHEARKLKCFPESVLARRDTIRIYTGSFVYCDTLGNFAKTTAAT